MTVTASAVVALDQEIKERSSGTATLDDVLVALRENPRGITLSDMQQAAADVIGAESVTLQLDKLPGCRSIEAVTLNSS